MFDLIQFGIFFEEFIKNTSGFLADDGWAGLICWMLLLILVALSGWYLFLQNGVSRVISKATDIVLKADDREEFSSQPEIRQSLNAFAQAEDKSFTKAFGRAWEEYEETLTDPEDDETSVRNTVRPHYFFNMEDLGQTSIRWRQIPNIFVSVGLLLTFLGIISAIGGLIETELSPVTYKYTDTRSGDTTVLNVKTLNKDGINQYAIQNPNPEKSGELIILRQKEAGENPTKFSLVDGEGTISESIALKDAWEIHYAQLPSFDDQGMSNFLDSAKSKFLMSLTGLFCSICFTLIFRIRSGITDRKLHIFCDELEYRVLFQTPESIANDQLIATQQQTVTLDKFNTDLAATISNTLTKDLPKALSKTLDPVIKQVLDTSGNSVDTMVQGLGDSLHEKLNASLNEIAQTLTGVNTSLVALSDSLGSSGESVATEINKAITDLSASIGGIRETLGKDAEENSQRRNMDSEASQKALSELLLKIEENTREGTKEMKDAAEAISSAAKDLRDSIAEAGEQSSKDMSAMLNEVNENARGSMTSASTQMAEGMREASETIVAEGNQFRDGLQGVITGPIVELENAIVSFSKQLNTSTSGLEQHGNTISTASKATNTASNALQESADSLKAAANPISVSVQNISSINERISIALKASADTMDQSKTAVDDTLSSLRSAVERFDVIIENASGIDQKLGAAFTVIKKGLEESQNEIRKLQMDITDKMAGGISSLQQVVEGIDEYKS